MDPKIEKKKIKELRNIIDSQLRNKEVYGSIKTIISNFIETQSDNNENEITSQTTSSEVLQVFKERGILQSLISSLSKQISLSSMHEHERNSSFQNDSKTITDINRIVSQSQMKKRKSGISQNYFVHIKVISGKAFLEFDKDSYNKELYLSISFGEQRFLSSSISACVDPKFDGDFLVHITDEKVMDNVPRSKNLPIENVDNYDLCKMLLIKENIHINVFERNMSSGGVRFVGGHMLEWRKVLKKGIVGISLEMGKENLDFAVGVLELRLELLPRKRISNSNLISEQLKGQIMLEKERMKQEQRDFYLYSEKWYEEYLQVRKNENKKRIIKIYAQTEFGETFPVVCFVQKIYTNRIIDSPSHAARFVSLIDMETRGDVTKGNNKGAKETWYTMHTFLNIKRGCIANHSILLCNILLGFGMDAYVCIGYGVENAMVWVATRTDKNVTFWDAKEGTRMKVRSIKELNKYRTIDMVFNDEIFYANIQSKNDVLNSSYEFENTKHWKSMSAMKLSLIPKIPFVSFIPSIKNDVAIAIDLEKALKKRVGQYRSNLGLTTKYDDKLSYILQPALYAYENERISGLSDKVALHDFRNCVKRNVKSQHTFKAFPIHVNSDNENLVFNELLKRKSCRGILETVGDEVKFGIRVKSSSKNLPDGFNSIWVIICVRYQSVQ